MADQGVQKLRDAFAGAPTLLPREATAAVFTGLELPGAAPGATLNFFLFGDPSGTGSLGWYAAYVEDKKTKPVELAAPDETEPGRMQRNQTHLERAS